MTRWRGYSPLLLFIFLLVGSAGSGWKVAGNVEASSDASFAQIVAKFELLEAASVKLEKWKRYTNEQGALAWATSYLLESYLDMWEATRDRNYLDMFTILANALVERTDAQLGLADYKGRKRVGWGSVRYSKAGERIVWLVHTGMITYPLTRLALIVSETPALADLAVTAVRLRTTTEAALREFDGQWRYDLLKGLGYYVYEDDEPQGDVIGPDTPLPFNQQLAAGRSYLMLWSLTRSVEYRQKVEALGRHFQQHLRVDGRGAYVWDYWYDKGLSRSSNREDVSHGAIDVDFAVQAGQASLVFTVEDLKRFALAFYRDTNTTKGRMGKPSDASGLWLGLAKVDCGLYRVVAPYLMGKVGSQPPQVLLGVAELTRYFESCARK